MSRYTSYARCRISSRVGRFTSSGGVSSGSNTLAWTGGTRTIDFRRSESYRGRITLFTRSPWNIGNAKTSAVRERICTHRTFTLASTDSPGFNNPSTLNSVYDVLARSALLACRESAQTRDVRLPGFHAHWWNRWDQRKIRGVAQGADQGMIEGRIRP